MPKVEDFTNATSIQALLTVIVTVTLMIIIVLGRVPPDYLIYAWFALVGLYMELPNRKIKQSG